MGWRDNYDTAEKWKHKNDGDTTKSHEWKGYKEEATSDKRKKADLEADEWKLLKAKKAGSTPTDAEKWKLLQKSGGAPWTTRTRDTPDTPMQSVGPPSPGCESRTSGASRDVAAQASWPPTTGED